MLSFVLGNFVESKKMLYLLYIKNLLTVELCFLDLCIGGFTCNVIKEIQLIESVFDQRVYCGGGVFVKGGNLALQFFLYKTGPDY